MRSQTVQGTGTKQRLPITIAILRKLYKVINLNDFSGALFWAACLTGFFCFLRCGEFTSLMNYLHHRGNNSGPLFLLQNGQPLSRDKFCTWLRNAMTRIGETGHCSGHSFRIGAAATAAAVGIPDHLIKTLGRWISDAY